MFFFLTALTVLEKALCICFFPINSAVNLLYVQLRMFDLNGDGKLGLSEMARWVRFHLVPVVAAQTSLAAASSLSVPPLSTGSCPSMRTSCSSLRSDFPPVRFQTCGSFRRNSDSVVQCYWIHFARIIGHQITAWTYGIWHKCIFPLTLNPSGFE